MIRPTFSKRDVEIRSGSPIVTMVQPAQSRLSPRSIDADNPDVAEKIRTEADYFARNAERMRYPQFRH